MYEAFQAASKYYFELSGTFANATPNAGYVYQEDGIFLNSTDYMASRYYLQIDVDDFNRATYWSTSNMNPTADFVVTITVCQ